LDLLSNISAQKSVKSSTSDNQILENGEFSKMKTSLQNLFQISPNSKSFGQNSCLDFDKMNFSLHLDDFFKEYSYEIKEFEQPEVSGSQNLDESNSCLHLDDFFKEIYYESNESSKKVLTESENLNQSN
jgi:hypothetical protein